MSILQNSFWTLLQTQKQAIRAQKGKNDPKIEENIEKVVEIHEYNSNQFQNPALTPKIAH